MNDSTSSTRLPALLEHSAWIRRLAGCLVRDDAQADDLTQEAWLVALRHPPSPELPPRPWLGQVVRNLVRMKARGERRRHEREQATADAECKTAADGPDQLVARAQAQQLLAGLVVALAEPYRSTVLLRYYEGLSAADIAARQGVPAGTVRWRLKKGLDELRVELDRTCGGDRGAWQLALGPLGVWPTIPAPTGGLSGLSPAKGALFMKPLIPVVIFIASVAGGLWATRSKAAPLSAAAVVRTSGPRPVSLPVAASPALPKLDDEQRAWLLQRMVKSRRLPAAAPGAVSPAVPQLDPEYIRSQMQALLPMIKECYENTLRTQPRLSGKLVVEFTIVGEPAIGGLVSTSSIDAAQSTIADAGMRECVQETIYGAQFPAPAVGGEVQVSYPFSFTPGT